MASIELRTLAHTIELSPRYAETDQMGVVYHANYLIWFHEARDALLGTLGVDAGVVERAGYRFPIVDMQCCWQGPARYGEPVLITATPMLANDQEVVVARLRIAYQVHARKRRRLIARGETTNVMTDRNGNMLLRLPACFSPLAERLRTALSGEMEGPTHV